MVFMEMGGKYSCSVKLKNLIIRKCSKKYFKMSYLYICLCVKSE